MGNSGGYSLFGGKRKSAEQFIVYLLIFITIFCFIAAGFFYVVDVIIDMADGTSSFMYKLFIWCIVALIIAGILSGLLLIPTILGMDRSLFNENKRINNPNPGFKPDWAII